MNQKNLDSDGTLRFLEFNLGAEIYAIPLLLVREVISVPETTSIPQAPHYFKGIINLRGQIISIIDLREKLKIEPQSEAEEAVIILDFQNFRLGVIVDTINKVLTVKSSELRNIPQVNSQISSDYIETVFERGGELIISVDISKVLDITDIAILNQKETA